MTLPVRSSLVLAGVLAVSACVTSTDPADGGFFNGVSGIATGAFDNRIAARESEIAAAQERNAGLEAQIRAAEAELAQLKLRILNQRNAIGATDAEFSARVETVLNANPDQSDQTSKLVALQNTIADARALSEELSRLAG